MTINKITVFSLAASLAFHLTVPASANRHEHDVAGQNTQLLMPKMNPERGKKTFVNKGCIACHSVNGVGGQDAPAMDDHTELGNISLFDFAAKMWNSAPGMLAAQEEAFGEQILLTGDELADIIAFVHDDESRHSFSKKDLTKGVLKMMDHGHGGGESAPEDHAEDAGHDDGAKKEHTDKP